MDLRDILGMGLRGASEYTRGRRELQQSAEDRRRRQEEENFQRMIQGQKGLIELTEQGDPNLVYQSKEKFGLTDQAAIPWESIAKEIGEEKRGDREYKRIMGSYYEYLMNPNKKTEENKAQILSDSLKEYMADKYDNDPDKLDMYFDIINKLQPNYITAEQHQIRRQGATTKAKRETETKDVELETKQQQLKNLKEKGTEVTPPTETFSKTYTDLLGTFMKHPETGKIIRAESDEFQPVKLLAEFWQTAFKNGRNLGLSDKQIREVLAEMKAENSTEWDVLVKKLRAKKAGGGNIQTPQPNQPTRQEILEELKRRGINR